MPGKLTEWTGGVDIHMAAIFFSNITGREGSSNLTFSDSSAIEKTMERENLECHQAILSRYNNLFDSPLASVG